MRTASTLTEVMVKGPYKGGYCATFAVSAKTKPTKEGPISASPKYPAVALH